MKALVFLIAAAFLIPGCRQKEGKSEEKQMKEECFAILRKAASCNDFWVRVHAIEFLAELGSTSEAAKFIADSLSGYAAVPQKRIGLWRSLYKVESDSTQKSQWLKSIRDAYGDVAGPDRIHAAETLSKLRYSLKNFSPSLTAADLANGGALAAYVHWGAALPVQSDGDFDFDLLWRALESEDVSFRGTAAYALTFLDSIPRDRWNSLMKIALVDPIDSEAKPPLLGAVYALSPSDTDQALDLSKVREALLSYASSGSKAGRIELCRALARKPDRADLKILEELARLKSPLQDVPLQKGEAATEHPWNLDVQAAAAYAILKIYAH